MKTMSTRELNRATLARQHLLQRVALDPVTAIERLAGMQAQHSPSPYIGLWSRLHGFEREHLEDSVRRSEVIKATLMRGTLHLVPRQLFPHYRLAGASGYYADVLRRLSGIDADLDAIRKAVVAEVRKRPLKRTEVAAVVRDQLGAKLPKWAQDAPMGLSAISVSADLINLPDDAVFGYHGGSRYRLPPRHKKVDPAEAKRVVARAYFSAFGPASKADLASWSGATVASFADTLGELGLVSFRAEDGRTLLDLPDAPRPDASTPAPVRFLPKWDNILLAHAKRERMFPGALRKIVIRGNGDVLPTFLVDGSVAGTWSVPMRGKAVMSLQPLGKLTAKAKKDVGAEGMALLEWLRPDAKTRDVAWA